MQQELPTAGGPDASAYAALLDGLESRIDELAARVAGDVVDGREPGEEDLASARAAVRWLLASLRRGPIPGSAALRPLQEAAAAEARAGRPVQPVLDRALSAGWVVWAAATAIVETRATGNRQTPAAVLAGLGDALLRTGDAAATAIADAHATAERELAIRSASALRELLDELLELAEGDDRGRARLGRRLAELGIAADRPITVLLVDAGRDLEDGDRAVAEVARRIAGGRATSVGDLRVLGGPASLPVVAATRGRLVLLLPGGIRGGDPRAALEALGDGWTAVSAPAADVLTTAAAVREATAALVVAVRLGRRDRVTEAGALRLERAMLAEPALLRAAVDRELGPLARAPRGSDLVATVEAYLAERENIRAAGRRLGVAPRTVAYRLARVEALLDGRLDADRRLRLATALFAQRLLEPPPAVPPPARARPRRARN